VRVRLTRVGSRKNPIWRVVVADQRSPRDGRVIEQIGHYNPQTQPSQITLDRGRLDHWLARGAQPTNTVRKLMKAVAPGPAGADGPAGEGANAAPKEAAGASGRPDPEAADEDAGSGE
jgi:small subunit ribosomal protein S16